MNNQLLNTSVTTFSHPIFPWTITVTVTGDNWKDWNDKCNKMYHFFELLDFIKVED